MSRSGYVYADESSGWDQIRWRGAVASATRGSRGQALLRQILAALDALPEKSLIGESLVSADGQYCTLGAAGAAMGVAMDKLDPSDWDEVAQAFGVAPALVREIVFENDEGLYPFDMIDVVIHGPLRYPCERHEKTILVERPNLTKLRWQHMRQWVASQIITHNPDGENSSSNQHSQLERQAKRVREKQK